MNQQLVKLAQRISEELGELERIIKREFPETTGRIATVFGAMNCLSLLLF